jgi:hypothetical protein
MKFKSVGILSEENLAVLLSANPTKWDGWKSETALETPLREAAAYMEDTTMEVAELNGHLVCMPETLTIFNLEVFLEFQAVFNSFIQYCKNC